MGVRSLALFLAVLVIAFFPVHPCFSSGLIVHYHRPDADYDSWSLWTWNPAIQKNLEVVADKGDAFGLLFRLNLDDYDSPARLGLLPKFKNWESKDDPDRFWTKEMGETVYILSADKNLYTSPPDVSPRVLMAMMEDTNRIRMVLSKSAPSENLTADQVVIRDGQGDEYPVRSVASGGGIGPKVKIVDVELENSLPLERISGGMAAFADYNPGPLIPGKIFDQPSFSTDLPLGAMYSPEKTVFRTFAPTALAVTALVYSGPDGGKAEEYAMKAIGHGIWEVSAGGDLLNHYYTYRSQVSEGVFEVVDPYAKSTTAHNGRGMIISDDLRPDSGPVFPPQDAIIYEMHIRDFTIDPASGINPLYRGKYLGLTEDGARLADDTSLSTGLDHLSDLGVNVVQIMPIFDFDNDESGEEYNWGYMPFHFFTPDGWFSTRRDDASRVREVKQMISALHRKGIKVVLDVVYNHTAEGNPNIRVSFNGLAPNYYYRLRDDGTYSNGSGCGNEFRSESPMGRKYILDSVTYWVTEYGVDGFRFDLMGLMDLETLKDIVTEVRKIKPDALIYGEPWAGGSTTIRVTTKGDQKGAGFSVFNDIFRDGIKGNTWSNEPGFVQAGRDIDKIKRGIKGSIDDFAQDPVESINYVEAHDNQTLWDRLIKTTPTRTDGRNDDRVKMDKLAAALVLTSQGIPFLQSGQEMLRTKEGEDNSYNKPDRINEIHWKWKKENREVMEFYKGLIHLRRAHPMFRMATADEVRKNIFFLDGDLGLPVPSKAVGYVLHRGSSGDEWANALLLFNANPTDVEFDVPPSTWYPAADSLDAASKSLGQPVTSGKIQIPGWTAGIFFNKDETFYESALKPSRH